MRHSYSPPPAAIAALAVSACLNPPLSTYSSSTHTHHTISSIIKTPQKKTVAEHSKTCDSAKHLQLQSDHHRHAIVACHMRSSCRIRFTAEGWSPVLRGTEYSCTPGATISNWAALALSSALLGQSCGLAICFRARAGTRESTRNGIQKRNVKESVVSQDLGYSRLSGASKQAHFDIPTLPQDVLTPPPAFLPSLPSSLSLFPPLSLYRQPGSISSAVTPIEAMPR